MLIGLVGSMNQNKIQSFDDTASNRRDIVILIIEDDNSIRKAIATLLTRQGYTALEATNGREGVNILKDFGVDLVITDIFMPTMDGLEVIRSIRKTNKSLKVIAISGGGQMHLTECLRWASAFGANKTLTKPIKHNELLDIVDELTSNITRQGFDQPPMEVER